MKKAFKSVSFLLLLVIILSLLASCGSGKGGITEVISLAESVKINGEAVDTVEARMGAFQGKQGDYIEFFFNEEITFDSFFINEKTTSVRQFNIYVLENDKYKLVHTGKSITIENIRFDESISTTAVKLVIVNTEIGEEFIIQGVSAYDTSNVSE